MLAILAVLHPALAFGSLPRAGKDRRDARQLKGKPQVHVIYAVPSDGEDRALDTDGTIDRSVEAIRRWLRDTGRGADLRFDSVGGSLDISFVRLAKSDEQIAAFDPCVVCELKRLLQAKGFNKRGKDYLVFYDGKSHEACGQGEWPGNYGALYLRGEVPGYLPCTRNPFAPDEDTPGYWEYALIHEIFHNLGVVAGCAPSYVPSAHVGDENHDLMYAGDLPWYPSLLDFNRDDYFDHANGRCLDLADSAYLQSRPLPAALWVPNRTRWPTVTGPPPCGRAHR